MVAWPTVRIATLPDAALHLTLPPADQQAPGWWDQKNKRPCAHSLPVAQWHHNTFVPEKDPTCLTMQKQELPQISRAQNQVQQP